MENNLNATVMAIRAKNASKIDAIDLNILSSLDKNNRDNEFAEHDKKHRPNNLMLKTTSSSDNQNFLPSGATIARITAASSSTTFSNEPHKAMNQLDIGFENIRYSVKAGFLNRENKDILNGLNGEFRSGELSAIVGPSGAGKSTFLKICSGYTAYGYHGDIIINGNVRDIREFKPNSSFLTQDTTLQTHLTVSEAMHFSANLKIGNQMTKTAKRERVRNILEAIGMYTNRHTRTGHLSGGQKKRLAIALELVNDPPVLILDEPTSGLDSSTANQCISLLKKLAIEGRTVICTIHQPSALAFKLFDHFYAIANGRCIYSGGTQNLVPFLADLNLDCPESYNPADYLMEIATDDYGKQNHRLVEKIQNGRNTSYRQQRPAHTAQVEALSKVEKMMVAGLITPVTAPVLAPSMQLFSDEKTLPALYETSPKFMGTCGMSGTPIDAQESTKQQKHKKPKLQFGSSTLCKRENVYATPFYQQTSTLLLRTFIILLRDKSLTAMRLAIHLLMAILIGVLYYGIGNDASNVLNSFRYIFYTMMFTMYTAFSSIIIKFPLEFPIVSREHFNRWYSLRAYYVAITLADIPILFLCTSVFILISYPLTAQPLEPTRIFLFGLMTLLTALVAQSIGLAVGASMSINLGATFGAFIISPFLTFSGFFLQLKDAQPWMHWLFHISFLKHGLDGCTLAIFGYDRPKLECSEIYCHFARPNMFLREVGMENANYWLSVLFLFLLFLALRVMAFYIMSFRLRLFR